LTGTDSRIKTSFNNEFKKAFPASLLVSSLLQSKIYRKRAVAIIENQKQNRKQNKTPITKLVLVVKVRARMRMIVRMRVKVKVKVRLRGNLLHNKLDIAVELSKTRFCAYMRLRTVLQQPQPPE
jgi:hypothetical protein